MGWEQILGLAIPFLGNFLGGGGGSDSPTSTAEQRALQQEMLKMIQRQSGYMGQMDPLRESVLKMAMGMLPTRYQTGGIGPAPQPAGMPPGGGGGAQSSANNPNLGTDEPYLKPGGTMDRSPGAYTPGYDPTLYEPYDPTTGIGHRWGGAGGYSDIVDQYFAEQREKGMGYPNPAQ